MAAKKVGVSIKKADAVEKLSSEGALDQNLGICVDDNMTDCVFLDSVRDENDIFARCPVEGSIDFTKDKGGKTVNDHIGGNDYVTDNIFLNPSGDGFQRMKDVATDRFAVSDAKWMDDPEELIWKSPLLAQLQAKHNAITHFLADPSAVDFEGSMSDDEKKIVAARARELAAALQDEALNQIDAGTETASETLKESIMSTKERFMEYTVSTKDAVEAGGLTADEVNELFQGGA